MTVPEGILCSKTHEWVLETGRNAIIGLTDYFIEKFGDIVFVELPEVGTKFSKDDVFATVESVRVASELYMPISGKIIEINEELINSPELMSDEQYVPWLVKVECEDFVNDSIGLIDYKDYIEENN